MPNTEFNSKAFGNQLLFTMSSLVIMFIDTIGSTCVILQCFIRMCLMNCYNCFSSICQIITFLPTCCIFFLTSKMNFFCSSKVCKSNNNSICIVIVGMVLIWLLYFGGITTIIKSIMLMKGITPNTTLLPSPSMVTHTSSWNNVNLTPHSPNSNLSSSNPDSPDNPDTSIYSDSPSNLDSWPNTPLRKGSFIDLTFLRNGEKNQFPRLKPLYLPEPAASIFHAESQAGVRTIWPPNFLQTSSTNISEYQLFEKFQDVMSKLFASTRNYRNRPCTKKVNSRIFESPTVPSFLRLILSPDSRTSKTLPMSSSLFITTPKTNETETIHRDIFRRYWQQGRFCG